ncbi:MAG TPA: PilX N-terminal domain-containing pilus assembly protein [Polyangiaceae bacterium]|nr:PilX N-terminal domain-containing pilus assembly protein [Polyangiaceae bacterium]
MPPHSIARRGERGAAVFVVMMVLTLLTAIGLFAVRSASLADLAAGYDREGAQATLVAEYAITASAAYLANDPSTVFIGYKASIDRAPQPCQSNALPGPYPGPSPRPGCYRLDLSELQTSFGKMSNETVFAPPNKVGSPAGSSSSLNAAETTSATFVVEVTDAAQTGVPAQGDDSKVSTVLMTLTAISQVRPAAACAASLSAPAAGQQVMRAMVSTKSTLL